MSTRRRAGTRHRGSRPARALQVALAAALTAAVLAGCSGGTPDDAPTGATTSADPSVPSEEATPSPTVPAPAAPSVVTVAATSGPVTLEVTVPESAAGTGPVVVTAGDEGAVDVTLVLGDLPATVAVTSGSLERRADGTLSVLDDDGTPVGGLTAPRVVGRHGEPQGAGTGGSEPLLGTDATATTPTVRVEIVDPRRAEVTLVPAAGATSGTGTTPGDTAGSTGGTTDPTVGSTAPWDVVASLGTHAVRSTDWGEREGGRSLAVDPTAWARAAGQAGQELVWAQVVAAEPEADTPTMHDQLVCHAVGAPDKETWNLEPWRPDVGLLATMTARCNPT